MGEASHRPLFSIIVPVYNVADYVAECLDSIRRQSYPDFEAIIVDDASTDDSAAIAHTHENDDSRLSVVRLPANVGLGGARNAGLAQATGRYVLFVDSDDALAPGALQAIASRIEAADSPDVVLFSYARTYSDGRTEPDRRSAALLRDTQAISPSQRVTLLAIIPSAWNKAYRREFVAEQGFAFPTGTYEDVPWTYPVLMTARTLVTLDRVCYLYRQRGGSNILATASLKHLDMVTQYDRVFAFLDQHPEYEAWRRPVFDQIAWHIPTVLETSTRVPPASRRAFWAACVSAIKRHHPAGYQPAGRLGLKVWLLEHSGYRAFRAAQIANQLRRKLDPRAIS